MTDELSPPLAVVESDGSSSEGGDLAQQQPSAANATATQGGPSVDLLGGSLNGSLEDLVCSFDEIVSACFRDYSEPTAPIAPVQSRSEEEILTTSQVWWTLTGNFGHLPPLNWAQSRIRHMHESVLPLRSDSDHLENDLDCVDGSEDEEIHRPLTITPW